MSPSQTQPSSATPPRPRLAALGRLGRRLGPGALVVLVGLAGFAVGQWMAEVPDAPSEGLPVEAAPPGDPHDHGPGAPRPAPAEAAHAHDHDHDEPAVRWTCSMCPQVMSDEPGRCPICGMDLIPVQAGLGVTLTREAAILAGIRTAPVEEREASRVVPLVGQVSYDETRISRVTAWVGGRIEALHVDYVGAEVTRGDRLFTIYSPELLVAQRELIEATRHARRASGTLAEAAERSATAARERLRLWGLQTWQIDRVVSRGEAQRTVTIHAPRDGTVTELNVRAGAYVNEGTVVFTVAELTHLWIELEAYERDLPWLRVGQGVSFEALMLPGEVLSGEIAFIAPTLDRRRRTARIRVDVHDPQRRLKPGAFVRGRVHSELPGGPHLVIPDTAPLMSGERAVVFVSQQGAEEPTYLLSEVTLGPRTDAGWVVVEGLMRGERIVVEGAFKLDSELQIRGDRSLMGLAGLEPESEVAGQETPEERLARKVGALVDDTLHEAAYAPLDELVARSKAVALTLSEDTVPAPDDRASLLAAVRAVAGHAAGELAAGLGRAVDSLGGAGDDLEAYRAAFRDLNVTLVPLAVIAGERLETPFMVTYCPMVFDNAGAYWLQDDDHIANPYHGSSMLRCGWGLDVVVDLTRGGGP